MSRDVKVEMAKLREKIYPGRTPAPAPLSLRRRRMLACESLFSMMLISLFALFFPSLLKSLGFGAGFTIGILVFTIALAMNMHSTKVLSKHPRYAALGSTLYSPLRVMRWHGPGPSARLDERDWTLRSKALAISFFILAWSLPLLWLYTVVAQFLGFLWLPKNMVETSLFLAMFFILAQQLPLNVLLWIEPEFDASE